MFPIPWYVAALVSVPEAFLILAISIKMMKQEKPNYSRLFLISVIQGIITLIIKKNGHGNISVFFIEFSHGDTYCDIDYAVQLNVQGKGSALFHTDFYSDSHIWHHTVYSCVACVEPT